MTVSRVVLRSVRAPRAHHRTPAASAAAPSYYSYDARRRSSSSAPNNRRSQINANVDGEGEPWWSLASLRERAATALASSLPDESLHAVHASLSRRMGRRDYADADDGGRGGGGGGGRGSTSSSIGEAIVSAEAREADLRSRSRSSRNDAEKQAQLVKEIERRATEKAQERMRLEVASMKEEMRRREEEERIRKEEEERERQRALAFETWKENASAARERESEERGQRDLNGLRDAPTAAEDAAEDLARETRHHPILGPELVRLPYKRVHLTSARTLASLPVYEKQRAYRHDRAKVMAKDKKKTLWMGVPGVISLVEGRDGRLSIVDGQHRVGMLSLLEEEQRKIVESREKGEGGGKGGKVDGGDEALAALDLNNILVEVLFPRPSSWSDDDDDESVRGGGPTRSEEDDRAAIFTEINKAEPVKVVDMPGATNKRTRDMIDRAAEHFRDAYPAMFSPSQRCRSPHLNHDNLREALFASEVIQRHKVGSGGELVKWMTRRNDELRERFGGGEGKEDGDEDGEGSGTTTASGRRVSETALKKARKHDFYLGLESTWLYK